MHAPLFFREPVPVTPLRHAQACVNEGVGFAFARGANSVPVTTPEFALLAEECAIVFAPSGSRLLPVALLGARNGQNLYVDDAGRWIGRNVPAYLKRYPFALAESADGQTFTLCVDEGFDGFNRVGLGQPLYDAQGRPTRYVEDKLGRLHDYRVQHLRTEVFCQHLQELDLLRPTEVRFGEDEAHAVRLQGLQTVDRTRLKGLPPGRLADLMQRDELELIYLHLQSLRHFATVEARWMKLPAHAA